MYKHLILFGIAAIMVFTPLARGAVRIWSVIPVLAVSYSLIFLWLIKAANAKLYKFKKTPADIPIAIFIILALGSFIFSGYKYESLLSLLKLFSYIGIYYLIVNGSDHAMRKKLAWLAIFIGTGLSIYGLLQYGNYLDRSWWIPKDFLASTFVNHNHLAGYLELVIPLALAIIMAKSRLSLLARTFTMVSVAVMAGAIILSQSRGGWMGLGLSLGLMVSIAFKRNSGNKKYIALVVIALVLLTGLLYFGGERILTRIDIPGAGSNGDASLGIRHKIWQGGYSLVSHDPVTGTGIGTFAHAFPRYGPEGLKVQANFAHNDYLQMASEMGLLAPFVMLWIFCSFIISAIKQKGFNPYSIGCAMGVMSLAIHGLVDFNFHIPSNMILFAIWCAIIAGESGVSLTERLDAERT